MDESSLIIADRCATLTPRERECLRAALAGETSKEAGRRLGIGYRTVQNYQQEAARKLQVRGTIKAARVLAACEEKEGVHVLPAPKTLAPISLSEPPSSPSASPTLPQQSTAEMGELPTGREVQLSFKTILQLIISWAVGISVTAVALSWLYRLAS